MRVPILFFLFHSPFASSSFRFLLFRRLSTLADLPLPPPRRRVLNVLGRDTSEAAKVYVWGSIVDTDEFQPEGGAFVSLSKVQAPSAFVLSEEGREVSGKVFEELKSEWKKIDGEAYKRVFE